MLVSRKGLPWYRSLLAGHLQLDNLPLIYDHNSVRCDGPLDWTASEDINSKMRASGGNAIDVLDGDSSVQTIVAVMLSARCHKGQASFINMHRKMSKRGLPNPVFPLILSPTVLETSDRGLGLEQMWFSNFGIYLPGSNPLTGKL
jgi:hypothetical protein